ncbi:MAG: dTDP-glucose 4,6-dehydratase [Treponemataceae bacterium]
MRKLKNILVTGGAGFIGSNFIRSLFYERNFQGKVINLDALTYAGNPANLKEVQDDFANQYVFVHGNICDASVVEKIFEQHAIDTVIHFAAESHVDRSIRTPDIFLQTNILGTYVLLNTALHYWQQDSEFEKKYLFHHISTDEVYGALGATGVFTETTSYQPRSPYSASKAASDHLVRAYYHTYNLPITISNCSNNYGPYQFPEKLIPLMILNIVQQKKLPIYGDGKQVRDWIHVSDHNRAVFEILRKGKTGETYNIGAENEWENIALLKKLIAIVCKKCSLDVASIEKNITHISDRLGHDRRYAIDSSKIKHELSWQPEISFNEGLERTVDWYLQNSKWIENIISGEYTRWIDENYNRRDGDTK